MNKNEILKIIKSHINEIKKYGIDKIGIFGSVVRNENKISSDLDILINFIHGEKNIDNYMDLKFYLEKMLNGIKIDLVIEESLKEKIKPYIYNEIIYAT